MKKRKTLAMGLAVALAVSCLTGCGGDDKKASSDGKTEQVLNISNNSVVVGLNPLINTTGPDNSAFNMVLDPLVKRVTRDGNTYEIIPAAAESWDISEDGLTYTFHMNKDAKWSDGTKVTANDFEFTFQKMATPSVAATNAWLFDGVIENFTEALYDQGKKPEDIGVHAIDEDTLEIKIIHPASYFLELVSSSVYPVNKAMYEELGSDYATSETKTVFNGPFKIESWSQNTEMVVVRNDQYWGADDVKLDKINCKIIQESGTAVQSYINGELDVIGTTDANWGKTIEEQGESESYQVPDSAPEFFMLNAANEYLCNEKIRQALTVAYDRQEMIDTLRNGKGVPIYSMMPDTVQVGEKTYTELVGGKNHFVQELQEEIKDPKALLIEGLKELGKDPDPSKVTIRYASRGTDELSKKIAEWMKQQGEGAPQHLVEGGELAPVRLAPEGHRLAAHQFRQPFGVLLRPGQVRLGELGLHRAGGLHLRRAHRRHGNERQHQPHNSGQDPQDPHKIHNKSLLNGRGKGGRALIYSYRISITYQTPPGQTLCSRQENFSAGPKPY